MMGCLERRKKETTQMEKLAEAFMGGSSSKPNKPFRPIFQPDDAKKFMQWGAVGFMSMGLYQMFMTLRKRNVNACVDFKDPVESMNHNPIIRDAMLQLQSYRELNPWMFKSALQNIDQLLFLEAALMSDTVKPLKNDKIIAWSNFRIGINRLSQFQYIIRKQMGNEHAMVVDIFIKQIYSQMQKHLLNILHLCAQFKPDNLIARAPFEVERVIKDMEQGREPRDTMQDWDRVREKLDKKRSKHKHKHRRHYSSDSDADSNSDEKVNGHA